MSAQPRRTPKEIEEVKKAHKEGYRRKHLPPPKPPKPKFGVARELKPKPFKPYPNPDVTSNPRYLEELDPVLHYRSKMQRMKAKGSVSLGLRYGEFTPESIHELREKQDPDDADHWIHKDYLIGEPAEKRVRERLKKNYNTKRYPVSTPLVTQSTKSPFYRDKPTENKKRKRPIGIRQAAIRKKQKRS